MEHGAVPGSERYIQATLNWEQKGSLGVTAEDHEAHGGTPDYILLQNPGKTLGQLMSDTEISEFITETKKNIQDNEGVKNLEEYNTDLKKNLKTSIKYLKSIGRLPDSLEE